ncbi:MAG: putative toxin-antitoxin system toxin component, PIN family [Candidatus Hadarchaeales archaeon]
MPSGGKKPKVVIDTSVYISGLTYPGRSREVLELMVKNRIEVYVSQFIIQEIERILQKKFGWSSKAIERFVAFLRKKVKVIEPKIRLSVITEKDDDNRILECALEGKAHYLVTGDKKHLLPIKSYQGVKILSPGEFLQEIYQSSGGS